MVSIVSEKVTEMLTLIEPAVEESAGEVEETVGEVVSGSVPVVNPLEVSY